MRIDMHTHAFPDKIAARALEAIMAPMPPKYCTKYDGRLATLLSQLKANDFDKAVLCQIATKPAQYGPILEWSQATSAMTLDSPLTTCARRIASPMSSKPFPASA